MRAKTLRALAADCAECRKGFHCDRRLCCMSEDELRSLVELANKTESKTTAVNLTLDEIDILMRLCSGCDDMDDEGAVHDKRVAMGLERRFRRILAIYKAKRKGD